MSIICHIQTSLGQLATWILRGKEFRGQHLNIEGSDGHRITTVSIESLDLISRVWSFVLPIKTKFLRKIENLISCGTQSELRVRTMLQYSISSPSSSSSTMHCKRCLDLMLLLCRDTSLLHLTYKSDL